VTRRFDLDLLDHDRLAQFARHHRFGWLSHASAFEE
jgi:hypothetical protein